jgi:hypothetical protein
MHSFELGAESGKMVRGMVVANMTEVVGTMEMGWFRVFFFDERGRRRCVRSR